MIDYAHFTPWSALAGGILIGLASAGMLLFNGRIAGISGIFGGLLNPSAGDAGWRASFVGGLLVGGLLLAFLLPSAYPSEMPRSVGLIALGGLLVGFGTRLGSGCTSGHGVCGLARFSPRSVVSVGTFMATGALMVALLRVLGGAA